MEHKRITNRFMKALIDKPIDAQKLTKEIIEAEAELRTMGVRPKSDDKPEQPNTELMIIKTIQGLISQVNDNLGKLEVLGVSLDKMNERKELVLQALEEIDLFQRTTLNKLQKAFE